MEKTSSITSPTQEPLKLTDFDSFMAHQQIRKLEPEYEKQATLAIAAVDRLVKDFEVLNEENYSLNNEVIFTTIEARVKTKDSFFRKLFNKCRSNAKKEGVSRALVTEAFYSIKDIAGVRFSCPYVSDIKYAIFDVVRERLAPLGYATELDGSVYADKDYLDEGDSYGYRSFHFFMKVPAVVDIYGNTDSVLCEVQARSELQHVWAVKSHDLLYKSDGKIEEIDDFREDMKQLSHHLKVADHFLDRIRRKIQIKGGSKSDEGRM